MKHDHIVEEELLRSIPVYFVSLLVIGVLSYTGYIQIGGVTTFILAFIVTVIHFKLMVKYRKKEYLTDPSIGSIINHMIKRSEPERGNKGYKELTQNFHSVLTILVIAYLIYRYAI